MGIEQRRSDRVRLTVPLWVMGTFPKGFPFIEDARTVNVNRYGAHIRLFRPLKATQQVVVVNLATHRESDFRVVGPLVPFTEDGGEYGIECLREADNIWDIDFPPPAEGQAMPPTALLECRGCQRVVLERLSLIEVDVLRSAGILSRPCTRCKKETVWGYPQRRIAMEGPPEEGDLFEQTRAEVAQREQRVAPRQALQLPLRVRDFDGAEEISRTENISGSGLCFVSPKNYQVGQGIVVTCPYEEHSKLPGTPARIVRVAPIGGSSRRLYGVRFELSQN
jgi:hypothetical protein